MNPAEREAQNEIIERYRVTAPATRSEALEYHAALRDKYASMTASLAMSDKKQSDPDWLRRLKAAMALTLNETVKARELVKRFNVANQEARVERISLIDVLLCLESWRKGEDFNAKGEKTAEMVRSVLRARGFDFKGHGL